MNVPKMWTANNLDEVSSLFDKPFKITLLTAEESKTLGDLYDRADVERAKEPAILDEGLYTNEFYVLAVALTEKHIQTKRVIMETFISWYNKHDRMILWMQANGETF